MNSSIRASIKTTQREFITTREKDIQENIEFF